MKRRILINPISIAKKISVMIVRWKIKIEWAGKKNCSTTIDLHSEQVICIIMQMSIIEELYEDIKKKMILTKPVFYVWEQSRFILKWKSFVSRIQYCIKMKG